MLDIAPGSPINDQELARGLGMGRTPVREALKRLETEHLVTAFPRRGTFATHVHVLDLAHLSEVRLLLEPAAAENAAARAHEDERDAFRAQADELGTLDPTSMASRDLMRLELGIHRRVHAATHNPHLRDTLMRYDNLATRIWCLLIDRIPSMAGHVHDHAVLLRAIADGNGALASESPPTPHPADHRCGAGLTMKTVARASPPAGGAVGSIALLHKSRSHRDINTI